MEELSEESAGVVHGADEEAEDGHEDANEHEGEAPVEPGLPRLSHVFIAVYRMSSNASAAFLVPAVLLD